VKPPIESLTAAMAVKEATATGEEGEEEVISGEEEEAEARRVCAGGEAA
jgi:hypothetical protein